MGAIAAVAAIYGTKAFDQSVNSSGANYNGYIAAAFILGAIAMIFTGFCIPIMMCIPELLIKVSLIGMLVLSGAMMVISFISGSYIGGIFGLIFFLIFACYARAGTFLFNTQLMRERESCTFHHELTFFLHFFPCSSLVSYTICEYQLAYCVHCGKEKLWRVIHCLFLRDYCFRLESLVVSGIGWRL